MTRTSRPAKTEEVSFTPSSPTPVTATGICNSKQPQQKNGNTGKAWTGLSSVFRKVARPYLDFSISLDFFVVICIFTEYKMLSTGFLPSLPIGADMADVFLLGSIS